jgi:urease accessory protein
MPPEAAAPGWRAQLDLHYRSAEAGRVSAKVVHVGPLRVLKSLYPEGRGICHQVLVHPPAGLVGGDELAVNLQLESGTHAVLTTPGATRFYRSEGALAAQRVNAQLAPGARLEWLPLETLVHPGALAANHFTVALAPGASMLGWDMLALGLPAAGQPFTQGRIQQRLEVRGQWLEAGVIDARDTRLLQSPLGLGGHTALGTLWCAWGEPLQPALLAALKDAALEVLGASQVLAGVTQPNPQTMVVRAVAGRTETLWMLFRALRLAWRPLLWGLPANEPRVWGT